MFKFNPRVSVIPIMAILLCTPLFTQKVPDEIKKLNLVVMIYKEDQADFLNEYMLSSDIVATWAGHAQLLKSVNGPKRLLSVPSITKLKKSLYRLRGIHIDYINYNPEVWITHDTPDEELKNLDSTIAYIRRVADSIGAKLSIVPDRRIVIDKGAELAQKVDLFGIQVQPYQWTDDSTFVAVVRKFVDVIKTNNPDVPVFLQFSTKPPLRKNGKFVRDKSGAKVLKKMDINEILRRITLVKDYADGIAFIYTEDTLEEIRELIRLLRTK